MASQGTINPQDLIKGPDDNIVEPENKIDLLDMEDPQNRVWPQAPADPDELHYLGAPKADYIVMTHDQRFIEYNSLVATTNAPEHILRSLSRNLRHHKERPGSGIWYISINEALYLCDLLHLDECRSLIEENVRQLMCFGCFETPGGVDVLHGPDTRVQLSLAMNIPVRCLKYLGLVSLHDIFEFQGVRPQDLPAQMASRYGNLRTWPALLPGEDTLQPLAVVQAAINHFQEWGNEAWRLKPKLEAFKNYLLEKEEFEDTILRMVLGRSNIIIVMVKNRYLLMRRIDCRIHKPATRRFIRNERFVSDDFENPTDVDPWVDIEKVQSYGYDHDEVLQRLRRAAELVSQLPPPDLEDD